MHAVNRWAIDCLVRSKIPGMSAMVPAATVILATRSSSVSVTVSYRSCLKCPRGRNPVTWGQVTWVPKPQGTSADPSFPEGGSQMIPHDNSETGWRHIVLEVHPLCNIPPQFWQDIVHDFAISPSVEAEWKNVWSYQPVTENAGPHINTESRLMSTRSSTSCIQMWPNMRIMDIKTTITSK